MGLQMPKIKSPLGRIHKEILRVLEEHPGGLDITEIREKITVGGVQQHLDRRLRDLDPHYLIERHQAGTRTVYRLVRERTKGEWDYETISKDMRARILTRDGRRCQMCGRTVKDDKVKLHIDHRIPRSWGGNTIEKNLWALCGACNEGKKHYFATFDAELMIEILRYESVHRRIAFLLRSKAGEWIDCDLIEFVANFDDYQTDWRKRLRELRYLGLKIATRREKTAKRSISSYKLTNWVEPPEDIAKFTREYERRRAAKNRGAKDG